MAARRLKLSAVDTDSAMSVDLLREQHVVDAFVAFVVDGD